MASRRHRYPSTDRVSPGRARRADAVERSARTHSDVAVHAALPAPPRTGGLSRHLRQLRLQCQSYLLYQLRLPRRGPMSMGTVLIPRMPRPLPPIPSSSPARAEVSSSGTLLPVFVHAAAHCASAAVGATVAYRDASSSLY